MATPRSQRIGIWIIAILMLLGVFGTSAAMMLSPKIQSIDQAQQKKDYEKYLEQQNKAIQANADNSEPLAGYSSRIFDANSVTKLNVEVLKRGTGPKIKETDSISSSYFGWTSNGKIFDSSKKKSADDKAISFSLSGVIPGWTNGLTGIEEGSVVRLTIPADLAYGPQVSVTIPANSPLEFIVEIHKIVTNV